MARIDDGYQTLIAFALASAVQFWEKSIKPPGLDGGGEIDITTMRNSVWRTRNPKSLITLSECTGTAAYDPAIYDSALDMLNMNQLITITFPDGSTLAFYGWLNMLQQNELVEGEQPTLEFTIIPSNQNGSGVETDPVYTGP